MAKTPEELAAELAAEPNRTAPAHLGGPRQHQMPDDVDLSDPNLSSENFERARPAIQEQQNINAAGQADRDRVLEIDAEAAARREGIDRHNREDSIRRGDTPDYMARTGDVVPNTASIKGPGEGDTQVVQQGQVDLRDAVMDPSNGEVGPTQPAPPEPMAGVEPDVGPMVGPEAVSEDQLRRESQADKKKRFDAMMTERVRARRGLEPLNPEARAAAESGGKTMERYHTEGGTPGSGFKTMERYHTEGGTPGSGFKTMEAYAADRESMEGGGQTMASTGGAKTAQDVATGGQYQTGQSVTLDALPGGQTSTKVYAMGGGIALPDGVGMSPEDFEGAYKQLNPGKSMVDAVQGLAREGGAAGRAARKILRNMGASGGANLSAAQKRQLESQLAGKAGGLLRSHAHSMDSGIASGSTALAKEEKDKAAREQEIKEKTEKDRKAAYDAAIKRFEKEPGRDMRALFDEEMGKLQEREAVMGGGDVSRKVSPAGPDARSLPASDANQNPTSLPAGSPEGFEFRGKRPVFTPPDGVGPLPAFTVKDKDGNPVAAAYLENADEAKRLPSGTPYVINDDSGQGLIFNVKGTPGRPSGGGATSGSGASGGGVAGDGRTIADAKKRLGSSPAGATRTFQPPSFDEVREDLERVINQQYDDTYKEVIKTVDKALENLNEANASGDSEQIGRAQKHYDKQKQALDDVMANKPKVDTPTIEDEIRRRKDVFTSDATAEQAFRFASGDADVIKFETDQFLPSGGVEQRTPSGTVLNIDGQNIPMTRGENGIAVVSPENVDQIIALEANAQGNMLTSSMGESGVGAATNETYQQTTALRNEIESIASGEDGFLALTRPGADQFKAINSAKEYLGQKYPMFENLSPLDKSKAVSGFLKGMGFVGDNDPRAIAASKQRGVDAEAHSEAMTDWEAKASNLRNLAHKLNKVGPAKPGSRHQEVLDELEEHSKSRPEL